MIKVKYLVASDKDATKMIEKKGTLINFAAYPVTSVGKIRVPQILANMVGTISFWKHIAAGRPFEFKIQSGVELPVTIETKEIAHVAYVLDDKTKTVATVSASIVQIISA